MHDMNNIKVLYIRKSYLNFEFSHHLKHEAMSSSPPFKTNY